MRTLGWVVGVALLLAPVAAAGELLPAGVTEDSLSAEPALVRLDGQAILFVRLKTVRNTTESSELISSTFKRIWKFAAANQIKVIGSPMEIMTAYQEADGSWHVSAAIPVATTTRPEHSGDIQLGTIGGGEAVQAAHRGDHNRIKDTHSRIEAFLAARGLTRRGKIVEQHFDDPHKVPAEKLRSSVTFFLE